MKSNEYLKLCAQKFFLQPDFLKILLWSLFLLLTTVFFRGDYESLIATNVEDCAILCFAAFGLLVAVVRLVQFLLWFVRNKGTQALPESSPLKWNIVAIIQFVFLLAALVVFGSGHTDITVHCFICGAFIVILIFSVTKNIVGKENKKKLFISFFLASVIVIAGIFGITQWASAQYNKNLSKMLNHNGLPVSVSDFIETGKDCKDKTLIVKSSVFGEHYFFSSRYEKDENTSYYLNYEVLVSDYDWVKDGYIDLLHKRYEEYESELVGAENSYGWDELFFEVLNGEVSRSGYAVKDNAVIMLNINDLPEESDFFKKAYENFNG